MGSGGDITPRHIPCNKDLGDLPGEGLCHLSTAHVGNAVQGKAHEGGVSAGKVILDGIVDQADQLTVGVHQHRDEEVTLGQVRQGCEELPGEPPYPVHSRAPGCPLEGAQARCGLSATCHPTLNQILV